jgi:hypothetical protein
MQQQHRAFPSLLSLPVFRRLGYCVLEEWLLSGAGLQPPAYQILVFKSIRPCYTISDARDMTNLVKIGR